MRLTLGKFNLAALAALTAPAVLIFETAAREHGAAALLRVGFYAALALGLVFLNQAMTRLSDDRLDGVAKPLAGAAVSLGSVAALLIFTIARV